MRQEGHRMEEILMRFPQIGEKILLNLDDESLQNCRRVNLTWKHFIEDPTQKQICIRIIKQYEKCTHIQKYISTYGNWNELKSGELGKLVKEIKETKNKYQMELLLLDKYEVIGTKLNAYDERGMKILHWYTSEVNNLLWENINYPKTVKIQVAKKLLSKFLELDIDVNAKQHYAGNATALHLACLDRNSEIVQTMIDMADATKLDLAALCFRSTALEFVTVRGFQEIIDIFKSRNIKE